MPDDTIFLDSNLVIYLYSMDEIDKRHTVEALLTNKDRILISEQVIRESVNVFVHKFRCPSDAVKAAVREIWDHFHVVENTLDNIFQALDIHDRFRYSF